jgi:hypothetical protein
MPTKKPRVVKIKPFADGTMTNAAFFGMIRSALRNKSRWFLSIKICKEKNRLPYTGLNKRRKWSYKCEKCHKLFDAKEINVHHKIDCGTLNSFDDLSGFTQRLFCDSSELICICNNCHNELHKK